MSSVFRVWLKSFDDATTLRAYLASRRAECAARGRKFDDRFLFPRFRRHFRNGTVTVGFVGARVSGIIDVTDSKTRPHFLLMSSRRAWRSGLRIEKGMRVVG